LVGEKIQLALLGKFISRKETEEYIQVIKKGRYRENMVSGVLRCLPMALEGEI